METRRRGGSFHADSYIDNTAESPGAESVPATRQNTFDANIDSADTEAMDNSTDGDIPFLCIGKDKVVLNFFKFEL